MNKKKKSERLSIALFNSAVAVSAVTMLWLLWHFPIVTVTTALIVLAGVALVASLAKSLDIEPSNESQDGPARLSGLR
jgi:membrane protein implicated in regulation of membrane protease activity